MLRFSLEPASDVVVDKEHPFAIFDLGLSAEEISNFSKLNIDNVPDRYAEFTDAVTDPTRIEKIQGYLKGLGNSAELSLNAAKTVQSIIEKAMKGFSAEAALIEIRPSLPHPFFNVPRWHFDGEMYSPSSASNASNTTQAKFVTVAKGPGTLFHPLHSALRTRFTAQLNATQNIADFENRKKLEAIVGESEKDFGTNTLKVPCGKASIFIVGPNDYAAIHSEPPIDEPRIFISVIPGSKLQIDEMQKRQEATMGAINKG